MIILRSIYLFISDKNFNQKRDIFIIGILRISERASLKLSLFISNAAGIRVNLFELYLSGWDPAFENYAVLIQK